MRLRNLEVYQINIDTVFLNKYLKEIYVEKPEGLWVNSRGERL